MNYTRCAVLICTFQIYLGALFGHAIPQLSELTLEEKVGQLLVVHFNGTGANADSRRLIEEAHVGGFIYYNWSNGLDSPEQVQQLSQGLQEQALPCRIPLMISVDQEGGAVRRLMTGFTSFPGNAALGRIKNSVLARQAAMATGLELKAVGVNINFAPVVDINSNPNNPVIGVRAFSACSKEVTSLGAAAMAGYQAAGIVACLKHFPGHGDVCIDSHFGLPVVDKSLKALADIELFPYLHLAAKADMIMTAHIMLPKIDPSNCATLSSIILEDILRGSMHYEGVIISDSLVMQAVLDNGGGNIENVALKAFLAGCDILLMGGKQLLGGKKGHELNADEIVGLHKYLVAAIREDPQAERRLNASVQRILDLKRKYMTGPLNITAPALACVGSEDHQKLAKEIASLSVQVKSSRCTIPYDFQHQKIGLIAPKIVQADLQQTALWVLANEKYIIKDLNPDAQELAEIQHLLAEVDVVVICTYNAWKNNAQLKILTEARQQKKFVVLMALRDARDADYAGEADIVATTVSPVAASIAAAWEKISGRPTRK